MNNDVLPSKCMNDDMLMICPVRCSQVLPDEIVCGLSLMIADAARSNCSVSCRFGQVAVVFGIVVAGNGVHGVLELLLLLLCSDIFDTYKRIQLNGVTSV